MRVMEEFPCSFVTSIGAKQWTYPSVPQASQLWFNSSEIRGGHYGDMNSLLPLDEELIESMRGAEAAFMQNVSRFETGRSISYDDRKQLYLRHLRFWNDLLEKENINFFLSGIVPHEIPDHLIYSLCKRKGIPTLMFNATFIKDRAFLFNDVDQSAAQLRERFIELQKEPAKDFALAPQFEQYFREQSDPEGRKAITFKRPTVIDRLLGAIRKNVTGAIMGFLRWLPKNCTWQLWSRRAGKLRGWRQRLKLQAFYDRHAVRPDLSMSFIYVPLQFQPESSTNPMAGAFVDQQLSVQLLAATAPKGVLLYVKEHPRQYARGFACRSVDFYQQLLAIPSVRLIAHDVSSFALRENCKAVATATGTAGFEALFREKPVFMFGHNFYQYASGVFQIRTREDCQQAMDAVFTRKEHPKLSEVRLFLKAMQDTSVHASLTDWHQAQASDRTGEEHTKAISDACISAMRSFFP